MSQILTDEEISQRIQAMDSMTDEQIFRKAAEIISNDPFLAQGAYLSILNKNDFSHVGYRPSWVVDEAPLEMPDGQFNCHCLEGSIHEAAGVYASDPHRPGWLIDVGAIGYHFDKNRSKVLNQILVQVLPLEQVASISGVRTIYDALHNPTGLVYTFSDDVLAPKGKEGVQLAAQYLTQAAELAAELAKEAS